MTVTDDFDEHAWWVGVAALLTIYVTTVAVWTVLGSPPEALIAAWIPFALVYGVIAFIAAVILVPEFLGRITLRILRILP